MKKLEKHHLNVPFVTSKSSFEVGLKVDIGKKHSNIEQIDGHGEVEDNNRYENTEEYWREGRLGNANFTYVDAMHLIEHCDTSEDSKEKEKENVLEVRKAD